MVSEVDLGTGYDRGVTATIAKGNNPGYYTRELRGASAGHYYTKAVGIEQEPPGIWQGRGLSDLGLEGGAEVDAAVFEELYATWTDPRVMEAARESARAEIARRGLKPDGRTARELMRAAEARAREEGRLGTAPYKFKSLKERLEEALAAEPYADERRRAEIELQVRKTQRHAVLYYDVTYSLPKSYSLLHAAYEVAAQRAEDEGRDAEAAEYRWKAEQVWAAAMDGNAAMLEYLQDQAGYARAGRHTKDIEGRTAGRYERADGWIVASFRQHTSRNDDPQLHVHNVILAKVKTMEPDPVTGELREVWRAIDGSSIYQHTAAAGAIAERVAAESLMRRIPGVQVRMRPDGMAREIVGISAELREEYSSRRRAVTEKVAELAAAYEERYGRKPGAHQLAKMAQHATLDTRKSKWRGKPTLTREQLLERWEAQAGQRLRESLVDVPERVEGRRGWRRRVEAEPFQPREVIRQAVEAVQAKKSAWTRADLRVEITRALPDCLGGLTPEQVRHLVEELTTAAVTPGVGPVEVVSLMPPEPVELPAELRREDGTSIYTAPEIATYATAEHLRREGRLVEAGRTEGAPAVEAELVEQIIAGAGLNDAQAEAVRGIATSGRQLDVLIGPAGTGKSKTVSVLCEVWEASGRPVMGVATSQRAADVLAEEGIDTVANLTKFIQVNRDLLAGRRVRREDAAEYGVRAGQLVIVDEAGMAATADMDEVRRLVTAAGGKVLTAGDYGQVSAVGAGGMLKQLAEDLEHVYVLEEVRRFNAEWERDASLRLRDGDAGVLLEYDRHGRLRDGSAEEMRKRAYKGWLADHLAGRRTVLVAPTNLIAGELAMEARAELVRLGRVEAEGVPLGCNPDVEQHAGVGDLVALRKNNRRITTGGDSAHWATNRDVVEVIDRGTDGSLTVRYDDGATMWLPPRYVAHHVELAYAGTIHSTQGRTVETCHALVDDAMSREQLYVALTRGQDGNYAYVICEAPEGMTDATPDRWQVLAGNLERTEFEASATTVMRREFERVNHLGVLGRLWEDLQVRHAQQRYAEALAPVVGEAEWRRLYGTPSYESLVRLARHADERGFDAAAMLAQVAGTRSLIGARDPGAALHSRLEKAVRDAEQAQARAAKLAGEEQPRRWRSYVERTPHVEGALGRLMMDVAEVMDARVAELGRRAAEERPAWAERLGPVPEDPIERAEWEQRAGIVARYREAHGYEVEHDAIGAAPPRGAVDAHAAWEDAYQALGAPEDAIDYARQPDAKLRELVARFEREKEWAPPYVDAELRENALAREDFRVQAEHARAAAEAEQDPQRRAELAEQAQAAETFAALHAARAAKLERVAAAYDAWRAHTEQAREQAAAAAAELERRHRPEPRAEAAPAVDVEHGQEQAAQPSAEDVLYARYAMARDAGEQELTLSAIAAALGTDDLHHALDVKDQMRERYRREREQAADQQPAPTVEAEQQPAPARDVDAEIDQALTVAEAALERIAELQAAERAAAREEAERAETYDHMRRVEQEQALEQEGPQLQM